MIMIKKKLSVFIAVLAASIALFAAAPAASYTVKAAEPSDSEVYAFSAEDDGAFYDDAGPVYDGMYPDASYTDSYDEYYYEDDTVDTNLTVGALDDATKEEIKEYRRQNVKDSLKIMGQGMLGIFVVMFLIYLVVVILNAVTKDNSDDEENGD